MSVTATRQSLKAFNTRGHHFRKRRLTIKTAITKAAAMAVVPWACIESPQRLTSSLSMAQLSLKKVQSCSSGGDLDSSPMFRQAASAKYLASSD